MQFGETLDYGQSAALLGAAADAGISFLDCAEMYPVPQRAATQGDSERHLGRWLKGRPRDGVTVCTKAAGPSGQMAWLRGGPAALDAANITAALEGSLARLQTDHVDLFLLHWPDRYVPMFGESEYDPAAAYASAPMEEQLAALCAAQRAGKVRAFGLSNETAWGLTRFCCVAEAAGLAKPVALQNAYSLLCRNFDQGLAEACHQERVGLLAYSPLAMGLLTGKYRDMAKAPPSARLIKYRGRYAEAEQRYGPKPNVREAVEAYCSLAEQAGMAPCELAIRFVLGRPLVASAVTGVTCIEQLGQLTAAAANGPLPADLAEAVDAIHQRFPNPTP